MKTRSCQLVLASALVLCANCGMAASWTDSFFLQEGQSSPLEVGSVSAVGVKVAVTNSDATVSIGTTTGEGMFRANLDGSSPRGTLSLGMPSGSYAPALWAGANVSFAGRETARDGWDYSWLHLTNTNAVNVGSGFMSVRDVTLPSSATSLAKTGAGDLAIGTIPKSVAKVSVKSGTLSLGRTMPAATEPAADPVLWLAADHLRSEDIVDDNHLSCWYDARGNDKPESVDGMSYSIDRALPVSTNGTVIADRTAGYGDFPTVVQNGLNGKPVIDFGDAWYVKLASGTSEYTLVPWGSGNSAIMGVMKSDGTLANSDFAREGFIVVAQNSAWDVPVVWSSTSQFVHGGWGYTAWGSSLIALGYSAAKSAFGLWSVDAVPVLPDESSSFNTESFKNNSYHLISFKSSSAGRLLPNLIASDRLNMGGNGNGGVRVAEIIYYYRNLTDAERTQTQKYLMDKWGLGTHPAAREIKLDSVDIAEGAKLKHVGGGTMHLANASGDGTLAAISGTISLEKDIAYGAVLHLDASDDTTIDTITDGDKTYVKSWRDVRSNGFVAYAVTNASSTSIANNRHSSVYVSSLPTYHTATVGSKTMPCVDLGQLYKNSANKADENITAATMVFNSSIQFAEGYIVFMDSTETPAGASSTNQRMTIWGLAMGYNNNNLLRGSSTSLFGGFASLDFGTITLDGNLGSKSSVPSTGKFHAYTLCLNTATAQIGCFGRDNDYRFGGIKVCEAIAFSERLDDTRRLRIEQYLMNKWFGSEHPSAASITKESTRSLSAAGGSTIAVTGDLIMASGGSLGIGVDAEGNWGSVAVSGELSFDGPLAVTVTSESSDRRLAAGDHVLMSAGSMPSPGSFDDWTLTLPTSGSQRGKLLVRDNKLVLSVIESGLIIIVK